jgi:hypothetical protein
MNNQSKYRICSMAPWLVGCFVTLAVTAGASGCAVSAGGDDGTAEDVGEAASDLDSKDGAPDPVAADNGVTKPSLPIKFQKGPEPDSPCMTPACMGLRQHLAEPVEHPADSFTATDSFKAAPGPARSIRSDR